MLDPLNRPSVRLLQKEAPHQTKDLLKIALIMQFATLSAIFLNIPILRQVLGFVYLSFIPGALILCLLKFDSKSKLNFVLLSNGLSIAFIMFLAALLNLLFPLVGVTAPLSTLPLTITVGFVLLALSFAAIRGDGVESETSTLPSHVNVKQVAGIVLVFTIPLLAILGAMYSSSLLLSAMILSIAALVIVSFFSRIIPTHLKPILILAIALSLLFQIPFISQHLVGFDIQEEFYIFRLTQTNSSWNPSLIASVNELMDYNGMLSVTVLPTAYSNLLGLSGEWVFRVIYLLFYSLVPVAMYQVYRHSFGRPVAFLAAFYFVLFPRFYAEERRQIIGELFLILLIFLILNTNISLTKRRILSIVFGAALVVSHYSIFYIFLFCAVVAWVMTSILKSPRLDKSQMISKRLVTSTMVLVLFVFCISWYTYVTPQLGSSFAQFVTRMAGSLTSDFTSLESRGSSVSDFVAPNLGSMSWVTQVDTIINKVPYILIVVGFVAIVKKFRNISLECEYFYMVSVNMIILAIVLTVPTIAPAFLPQRFYHISLLFLAPVCIVGGAALLQLVMRPFKRIKKKRSIISRTLCVFFIAIFLFKVGFVSEVTKDAPVNIAVSFTRMRTSANLGVLMSLYNAYSPDEDVRSITWLSRFRGSSSNLYADDIARKHVVAAYGMMIIEWDHILHNDTIAGRDSYIFLRYINLKGLIPDHGTITNGTGLLNQLGSKDQIYSNGKSAIYYSPTDT